jgi:hypothetical protein
LPAGPSPIGCEILAGGHVTDPPTTDTYSGVVEEHKSVPFLAFLLAGTNHMAMGVCMSNIGNTYVHAKTLEKEFTVATSPFGDDEGCIVIIVKAL